MRAYLFVILVAFFIVLIVLVILSVAIFIVTLVILILTLVLLVVVNFAFDDDSSFRLGRGSSRSG